MKLYLLTFFRTIWVLYIIGVLFNVNWINESIKQCEVEALPLPSSKALWDAQDKDEWEIEYNLELNHEPFIQGAGFVRYGRDLNPATAENSVGDWYAGIDEFGAMVSFVALGFIFPC